MASVRIATGPLKEAYDAINLGLGEINAQAVNHNAKTVLKTTLVRASIVAAGIFTTIAAATLIGYAFPATVGNLLLTKVAIALLSMNIFNKTFGRVMNNKFERNTNALLSKLNESVRKLVDQNACNLIYLSVNFSINMFDKLRFVSEDLYVKELKLEPYEKIESSYKEKAQSKTVEIRREKERLLKL